MAISRTTQERQTNYGARSHHAEDGRPTPFPLHCLPGWLREMVEAVARSTQTDPAMSAMVSLGLVSAAVARKAQVRRPSSSGADPLNLWVLVIAPSGENKSGVFRDLAKPLESVQTALEDRTLMVASPEVEYPSRQPDEEQRLSRYEKILRNVSGSSTTGAEDHAAGQTLEGVVRVLADAQQRSHPTEPVNFYLRDATPESIFDVMGRQRLGILQASPEGGFSSWIAGSSHRATGQLANLNLAWDGGNIRVNRIARVTRPIHCASLTMVFAPQPDAFETAKRTQLLRRSGYLPRFLVCFPSLRRGTRRADLAGDEAE